MSSLQLSNYSTFNPVDIKFAEVKEMPIPNNKQGLTYKKVNISTEYTDGNIGHLILQTPKLFSFGVSENLNERTGEVEGYSLPLCLHSATGATPDEKVFLKCINDIVDVCKKHLVSHKDEIGKHDLELSDLKKLNPIYQKKDEKGKSTGTPVLYPKIIMDRRSMKVISNFYKADQHDADGEPLECEFADLISTRNHKNYCNVSCALKIESIYIGNTISIQIKLYEADVENSQPPRKRMLRSTLPIRIPV